MKTLVIKLSICKCGFPVLKDSIGLGAEYEVIPGSEYPFTMICGGCGTPIPCRGIFVKAKGESHGGYLPKDIFDL